MFRILTLCIGILCVFGYNVDCHESKTQSLSPALKKIAALIQKTTRPLTLMNSSLIQKEGPKEFWKLEKPLEDYSKIVQHFYNKNATVPLKDDYKNHQTRLISFTTAAIQTAPKDKTKGKCELPTRLLSKFGSQVESTLAIPAPMPRDRHFRFYVLELNDRCMMDCYSNNSVQPFVDKYMDRLATEIRNHTLDEAHATIGLHLLKNSTFYGKLITKTFAGNISNFDSIYRLNLMEMNKHMRKDYYQGIGGMFLEERVWERRATEKSQNYHDVLDWNLYFGGWTTLLQEVRKLGWNPETKTAIQKMALWVKDERRNFGKDIESLGIEYILRHIKDTIPEEIAELFWATRCTLQNTVTKEYLAASKENDTQVTFEKELTDKRAYWVLEPYMELFNGSMKLVPFQIRSADWKRGHDYLCIKNPGRNVTEQKPIEVQLCYRTKHERRFGINLGWHLKPETDPFTFQIGAWNGTNNGLGGLHKLYPKADEKKVHHPFAFWQTNAQSDLKEIHWLVKCE